MRYEIRRSAIPFAVLAAAMLGTGCAPATSSPPSPTAETPSTPSVGATTAAIPPPALTQTFDSPTHGLSLSFPAGWESRAATERWAGEWPRFDHAAADALYDPSQDDHLFLLLASTPLAGQDLDGWAADLAGQQDECGPSKPVTIDDIAGIMYPDCSAAMVESEDRAYLLWLYTSLADPAIEAIYQGAFDDILATVQLDPGGAK